MHYIWEHRLWPAGTLRTVDGLPVAVIDPGRHNGDSGPDFFNAKVRIGDRLWAGNVEIHVRASDWFRHHHDADPAYDSVVLHVVDRDDSVVRRRNGEIIPQMRMPCNPGFSRQYENLTCRADIDLPCAGEIPAMSPLSLTDWLTALAHERLYDKTDRIERLLERFAGDWEQTTYVTVARALGFGINSEPFERLALATPLNFIGKHSDDDLLIEAMLMGQSGLLEMAHCDAYCATLKREYRFMAAKFGLKPIDPAAWKMSRMRPANLPYRRIATLAGMLAGGFRMFRRLTECHCAEDARRLFSPTLNSYWQTHYTLGGAESEASGARMSRSMLDVLIINTVVPLLHAYGTCRGQEELCHRAIDLLCELPPERNTIVSAFQSAGIRARDAFTTQALIQLRRAYCEQRKCLFCRIGHRILSARARRKETNPV